MHASQYPLCLLWHEVEIAQKRQNQVLATQAMLTKSAIAAQFGGDAARVFNEATAKLTDDR